MSADAPRAPSTSDEPILVVQNVSKHFGGVAAVADASLDVKPRSITALIGPNGAGKTTLFNVVTGFFHPERGRIAFKGERIEREPPHAIARRGLVRTFQLTKALTKMSVLDNMMLAAPGQHGASFLGALFVPWRSQEREIRERAMELLTLFKLDKLADDYAGTLSGGQRKLLEMARALMTEPTMLMLDEPMAGVNPTLGRQLLAHMELLRKERGITILYIEHDMEVVMNHSDRVIVMAEGTVIADGEPEQVRNDPAVIDAYLGAPDEGAA